jgi:glycine/D-amino acid oxidase-like deaminating enzyme
LRCHIAREQSGKHELPKSFVIVGAGIVGAAIAVQLAKAGHGVKVITAGGPDATSAAFGWINASFFIDADHHRLRVAGIAAWHRLADTIPLSVQWQGCLCWDMNEAELAAAYAALSGFDYPVEMLSKSQMKTLEPALKDYPENALFFPNEGAAHSAHIPQQLLRAAQSMGAQLISDVPVTAIKMRGDRAVGVETAEGSIMADHVIIAAGTGTAALAQTAGAQVPMVSRPAYILRTPPQARLLQHILATPVGEIRQEPSGQLLMPVALGHQGDTADAMTQAPEAAADVAMTRLRGICSGLDEVRWAEVVRAARPVPADDLPVVGELAGGLSVAVLHSGITLGPLIAELLAMDVTGTLDKSGAAMLAPYRPHRFNPS